jgi:hypothetical protein
VGYGSGHSNQDYSMVQGSAHGSAHGSAPVEDGSPVEEVAPVKAKKVSKRASKAKKNDNKETSKAWTTDEEIALCKAWCDVSENSVRGNTMKSRGFWGEVIDYFEKETGVRRGYNAITSKWRVRPRIGAFYAIIDNVERRNESGSSDLTVYQKALT